MKPALALLLIAALAWAWWRRQLARPVIAERWDEPEDGVQPVDPRTAALAAADARGWMTAAEEDIVYPMAFGAHRFASVNPWLTQHPWTYRTP